MSSDQAFTQADKDEPGRKGEPPRAVIVEFSEDGHARIRRAPPEVLVMVVESKKIHPKGKHSLTAGACGGMLAPEADTKSRPAPREIPVSFPG